MPELPEVETVMRGLSAVLVGHHFTSIIQHRPNLRFALPKAMDKTLCGKKITGLTRRAKYILVNFTGGKTLIIHLGMSGRMVIDDGFSALQKHDHVIFKTNTHHQIKFNDPRRFGMMDIVDTDKVEQYKLLKHLGVEPLQIAFSGKALHAKLKSKKIAVKLAIMDQCVVVGVGNIYACEALFASRIHPRRAANSLSLAECNKLVAAIKSVLKRAIAKGGSSLRDYVQTDGKLGYFQHEFAVYGREGEPCKGCTCKSKKVLRIAQGGRSTFYCASKQN